MNVNVKLSITDDERNLMYRNMTGKDVLKMVSRSDVGEFVKGCIAGMLIDTPVPEELVVKPHVRPVKIGRRVFYFWEELRQWVHDKAGGISANQTPAQGTTLSASRTTGTVATSRRAQQISRQLKSKPEGSTPKLSLVGSE